MTARSPTTGVLGGTFNPIHLGHLRAAEEVAEALDLDRVLFVPSRVPPHKTSAPDDAIAPAALRLEWARMALADHPRFEVDALEIEREGPSFLVDTLRALRERSGTPVFILGSDAFAEMGSWRDPEQLFRLAHFAVMTRPPQRQGRLDAWLPAVASEWIELAPDGSAGHHRSADTWIRRIPISGLEVSASEIRRLVRAGRSVRYLLPESVRRAVLSSGAYASGVAVGGAEAAPAAEAGPSDG